MQQRNNIANKIIIFTILGILLLPLLQRSFTFVTEKPLSGDIEIVPDVSLSLSGWFSGDFAMQKEKFINDNFGFRNFFVRVRNQFYFSVFKKVFAKDVVCGKDGYLYEIKYLKTFAGVDYVGENDIENIYTKLKFIQDTLEKKGKKLVVLFAPGKATFYPEYIPAPYNHPATETNYLKQLEYAKKKGVNFFDFNSLFVQLKAQSKYPLYPQTGTHWSIYGMHLAFDKLSAYLENLLGKKLLKYDYNNVTLSDTLRDPDGDIAAGINSFSELPHYKMAYPTIKWLDTTSVFKPRVLTVSDSYWMGLYFLDLPKNVYAQHEFWYYNKQLFNYDPAGKTVNTGDADLFASVEKNDVVFIMATEASLKQIGWGFINEVYNMYKNGPAAYEKYKKARKIKSEISQIKNTILGDEKWFAYVRNQARELKISVDSCLQLNAEYQFQSIHQSEIDKKNNEIAKIIAGINSDKKWYEKIVIQAKEMKISVDSCIQINAAFVYSQNHKDSTPKQVDDNKTNERIAAYKNSIRSDKKWLQSVGAKAKEKGITLDSAITLDAIWMTQKEQKQ